MLKFNPMKTLTIILIILSLALSIGFGISIYNGIGSPVLSTVVAFIFFLLLTTLIINLTVKK
jgi:hypothetical protein